MLDLNKNPFDEFSEEELKQADKETRDFFRRHPLIERSIRTSLQGLGVALRLSIDSQFRDLFINNPKFRKWYLSDDRQYGLLEGSIVGSPLHHPAPDRKNSLVKEYKAAGVWIGYDFKRHRTFGKPSRKLYHGSLESRLAPIVADNPADELTPIGTVRKGNVGDLFYMDRRGLTDLLEKGLLRETTYKEAFQRVERYDRYKGHMQKLGIEDEKVYQVTPKGNTLVYIRQNSGFRKKLPKGTPEIPLWGELVPALNYEEFDS